MKSQCAGSSAAFTHTPRRRPSAATAALMAPSSVAATRIEKNPRLLAELRQILRARGILREERLGIGRASLLGARALEECLEELAATGLTIYSVRGGA